MRRNLLVAGVVASLLGFSMWWTGAAQGQNRAASPTFEARVALVDLAYIFKNYPKYTRLYDELKADADKKEKELVQGKNELKQLVTKRNSFGPDTSNYKEFDDQYASRKVALERMAEQSQRQFALREASIHHQVYQEVEDAIARYAESKGITLVLRTSRLPDSVSASNPQDVMKEMSQQVLFSSPGMDITDAVLKLLDPNAGAATQPPVTNNKTTPGQKPSNPQPPRTTNKDSKDKAGGTKLK